jgi:hypothetical protein
MLHFKHRQNIFPVHTMKVYRGSRGIAPFHLNISTSWRQLKFTPWWLYTQGRSSEYPFYQRMGPSTNLDVVKKTKSPSSFQKLYLASFSP